jgi:flavodoxin
MIKDLSRRTMLTAPALLSLAAGTGARAEPTGPSRTAGSKSLVAYFSRSGNTRVIAGTIERALAADLFEIRPVLPYPEDYEQTVERARQERDHGYRPHLAATVPDMAAYDTLLLGFPIWGETTPPVIRSFLSGHDLSGKTLVPFVTHGGYGLGNSLSVVAEHAPQARLLEGFTMQADQERETLARVTRWLSTVRITE